jgi:pimeloyl-ACP methyl ester carboxylesterase
MGHLAGALADAGYLVVRHDKRGFGQTGGRPEAATLADYAEDARAVIRTVARRPDVDSRRIALVTHDDGAWVGMLTAAREGRVGAIATLAAPASTGAELVLEQQQLLLDQMKVSAEEREAKIEEQRQIHSAVLTGKGWGPLERYRAQADTPWFASFLRFDPIKALKDFDQPLLIVHGEIDRQIPVAHANRLANAARTEGDSKSVELVTVQGVNHLLVPATTGEPAEYGALENRTISKDVISALTAWLSNALPARR